MARENLSDLSPLYKYQEGMEWNPVEKVILERRSIRAFKKDPLPDSLLRRILEAGRFAPSAGNAQPWKFVVVKNPEILDAIERETRKIAKLLMWFLDYDRNWFTRIFLKPYTKFMIRVMPNSLHPVPFSLLKRIAEGEAPAYHGAPTLILMMMDKRGVSCPELDLGIAGQNMVLSAHSMGAGTCWIGMLQVLMYIPKWRKFFGVKYPYELNVCIGVGWPKGQLDGLVPREVQLVEWYDGGINDKPRVERQGE
ncbi:MAG: nitroreductase family protein [Acidobacteriota bacterium]